MNSPDVSASWKHRAKALGCYLVPNPFKGLLAGEKNGLVQHHYLQAMGLSSLLLFLGFFYLLTFLALSAALVYWRTGFEGFRLESKANWLIAGLFAVWILLLVAGCLLAGFGSKRNLPLARMLGKPKWLRRLAGVSWLVLWIGAAALALLAVQSARLARDFDGKPAEVYVLFDDMGFIPRWVMTLACYRLSCASIDRWEEGSIVVARISRKTLEEAFRHGSLIYLGTHGTGDGGVAFNDGPLLPRDIGTTVHPGASLRFVYLSACDSGAVADAWREALSPAEVITFDRLSAVLEHAWWLWLDSPRLIAAPP